MKRKSLTTVVIAASTFTCAALLSFGWSEQRGISLSVESAQARVGRPLTPMSGAGVARRHYRRGAYGYGAGVVGAGIGAAAAVGAATSPWGWGGNAYYRGAGYGGGPYYGAGAFGNSYGSYAAGDGGDTDTLAYCTQRFRSYDPGSGTYLGYDGLRHACP